MENQKRTPKKLWKPPSFDDFEIESPNKRIKLDSYKSNVGENEDFIQIEIPVPKTMEDLATHPKKIEEVKIWLEANQDQRGAILLVTGPAGSAKTTTVQITAQSLSITIREWVNPVDKIEFKTEKIVNDDPFDKFNYSEGKQIDKFEDFVFRTSRYNSLFGIQMKRIILVEDFPNIFIWKPSLFHNFLEKYKELGKTPIVFICTDDQNLSLTNNLFPNNIRNKCNIANIKFNPVAHTSVMRCLNKVAAAYSDKVELSKVTLENLSRNCNGDLRNALSGLQILLIGVKPVRIKLTKTRKKGKNTASTAPAMAPLSLKDTNTEFYQTLGRVLYPKRIATEPNATVNFENPNKIFVYDVREIVESYSDSFLMLLQENYVQTFSHLNDFIRATDYLSFCDHLSGHDELTEHTGLISVLGLMTSNKEPKRGLFKPIKKSLMSSLLKSSNENKRWEYSEFGATSRTLNLDIIPYLKVFRKFRNIMSSNDFNRLSSTQTIRFISSISNETSSQMKVVYSSEEENMEIDEDD